MNRLQIQISLMAGLAMMGATDVQPVAADSIRVPIRSANARVSQLDPNGLPAPAAASPPGSAPLPPPPVPDYDQPASPQRATAAPGGGAMYRGPLGADFQRPETPKKQYLGDGHLLTPQPIMNGPVPFNPNQPGMVTGPGIPHESEVTSGPVTGTDPYGIAPPPGTLGQTYHRRSRLIDDEKHPRVGIVEVHLSENYEVSAKGLKVKWTGKVWRLESDPLLPGIPHIYEVKSEWGPEGAKQNQVRSVRLIMGRIVDLDF